MSSNLLGKKFSFSGENSDLVWKIIEVSGDTVKLVCDTRGHSKFTKVISISELRSQATSSI